MRTFVHSFAKRRKEAVLSHFCGIRVYNPRVARRTLFSTRWYHSVASIACNVPGGPFFTDQGFGSGPSKLTPDSQRCGVTLVVIKISQSNLNALLRRSFGQLGTAGTAEPHLKRSALSLRQSCHPRGGFLPAPHASWW